MLFKSLGKIAQSYRNLSLQNIITLPFLLQIFCTVGLVGYLSWRNGEQAVNNVTTKLRSEVTAGVEKHLESYLETPQLIVQLKQNSTKLQQLKVADFSALQQDFWSTIQLFDSVRAIYIADRVGKFIYIKHEAGKFYSKEVSEQITQRKTYLLNNSGQKQKLLEIDRYEPRERPWYINTQLTQNNNWSKIYPFTGGELGITAAGLLQDNQGNTQGIVGVDLVLTGIGDFLQDIEISDNGEVFILERNGYLVASSTDEAPFIYDRVEAKEQRLRAIDSKNLLISATSQYITEHFRSLYNIESSEQLDFKLKNKGDRQLVQVLPYQDRLGLDWLIVVVIPEADFMAEINASTRNTIWLCLLAMIIAAFVGIYTSRKIAQPIANLSQVTNLVAQRARARNAGTNFYPLVRAKSIKELKILAQSFNEMVIQLKAAFKDLETTNDRLEDRVKQRTEALMAAKEAADAANRVKSEFLANMSHELRTPLHAILGFTQVALQDSVLKPQQRDNLVTVKRSGEHLLTLINDILEMSKIEAGSVLIDEKPCDLHLLLENLAKMFKLRLAESFQGRRSPDKNLELIFDLAPQLPQFIRTDPIKLKQILINLIENGIKFTDRGKVILRVKLINNDPASIEKASSKSSSIAFTVEDTGCGILPSDLESIFVPFSQTRQIAHQEGTGLGLAISQQFVRLLGGEIKVSSILGQGSRFEFQIPITIVDSSLFLADNTAHQLTQYPDLSLNRQSQEQKVSTSNNFNLSQAIDVSALANMTSEWIVQLKQTAIQVDADSIQHLLEQIPSEDTYLTQGLTRMLENFEYDEIIELTEHELDRRKE